MFDTILSFIFIAIWATLVAYLAVLLFKIWSSPNPREQLIEGMKRADEQVNREMAAYRKEHKD